jgi:hypothetical protein
MSFLTKRDLLEKESDTSDIHRCPAGIGQLCRATASGGSMASSSEVCLLSWPCIRSFYLYSWFILPSQKTNFSLKTKP